MKNYKTLLDDNRAWAEDMIKKIDAKMQHVTLRSRNKLPDGVDENGIHVEKTPTWWVNGFWGGLNWLLYHHTGNEEYFKTAKRSEELLDKGLSTYHLLNHDVGFIWHILSGALHTLTGDEGSKTRNLFAASILASRFVKDGNFIVAWTVRSLRIKRSSIAL